MKSASVHALQEELATHAGDQSYDFINVCTPAEYAAEHIDGVRSVPLDEIQARAGEFADKKKVYVHCRSGGRSRMAIQTLESLGVKAELVNVEGGIMAWAGAGFKTK